MSTGTVMLSEVDGPEGQRAVETASAYLKAALAAEEFGHMVVASIMRGTLALLFPDYQDVLCRECGDDSTGGDGYDGLCGPCADRAEKTS